LTASFLSNCSRKWSKEKPVISDARSYSLKVLDHTIEHSDEALAIEKQQIEDLNTQCLEKPCVFLSAANYCKIAALIQSCKMWDHTYFDKANNECVFKTDSSVNNQGNSVASLDPG
jgi:hypothetical protein